MNSKIFSKACFYVCSYIYNLFFTFLNQIKFFGFENLDITFEILSFKFVMNDTLRIEFVIIYETEIYLNLYEK